MTFLKADKKFFLFLLWLGLYCGIAFAPAMSLKVPKNIVDALIILAEWCFISFGALCLWGALAINKYIFAAIFPALNIICSILTYYSIAFNFPFNPQIIDAVLHSDLRTAGSFISWQLIILVVFNFSIAIVFVRYRFKIGRIVHSLWYVALMLGMVFVINGIKNTRILIEKRIPYNIYYNYIQYLSDKKEVMFQRPDNTAGTTCSEDSLTVVYVQGETLRRDHLSLNGYQRQTTPLLQKDSVISFSNIYSPFTYTDISLAHIFTNADSLHEDRAYTNRSFISFYKKCGFKTAWISNQELGPGYSYFAYECDIYLPSNIPFGHVVFPTLPHTWLDGDLLQPYKKFILSDNKRILCVVHTIGSHYFYAAHYPKNFAVFKPDQNNHKMKTREEGINSYDNSVLYTDFVVDSMIQLLKNKNAVLIYLSDHGESLGENKKWFHPTGESSNHEPACFVWLSDKYKQKNPLAETALKHNADKYFNSSFLFPSILDAAHIQTPLLDTSMSIFRRR